MHKPNGKIDQINIADEKPDCSPPESEKSSIYRFVLSTFGMLFVGLGILGIFLPLLPTTIFLILAAACFIRSSDRLHNWLTRHRVLGTYLRFAQGKSGIPMRAKVVTLIVLWATILTSAFYFVSFWWLRILLLCIATAVSIFILTRPTLVVDQDHTAISEHKSRQDESTCPTSRGPSAR